jgi:thiol-disulfide isomerase/thioredoxin
MILLVGCSSTHPVANSGSSDAGRDVPGQTYYLPGHRTAAPQVSAATLAGGRVALADVLGRGVVVVNVWASWCVECRAESRALARLSTALRPRGVQFVGIDEQDIAAKARTFARAAHTDYPQMVDPYGTVLAKLTMLPGDGIPSTLVIDRHARIAARIVGAARETELRALIGRISDDR